MNCTKQFSILVFCFSKVGISVENENVMLDLMNRGEVSRTFAFPGYYEIVVWYPNCMSIASGLQEAIPFFFSFQSKVSFLIRKAKLRTIS